MSSDSSVVLPQEINTRYKIHYVIGSGAYGTVYEAMDNVAHEINVLSPPDLTNYSSDNGGKDMLMKEKERDVSNLKWNLKDIKWILYQLLCGLEYLHSYKIIHRDIKPSNILITDQNEVRICDFGLSREMKEIENETYLESDLNSGNESLSSSMTKHVVTRFYRAPELCLCENYNEKIDVWAVGCIMSELFDYLNVKCERVLPLFPGSNSILSIKDLVSSEDIKKERFDENSQIYRIIQILGYLPKDDLDWIRNIKTRNYIQEMSNNNSNNNKINNNKINFDKRFEHIKDKNGIELIKSMLIYNPHKRISIRESLKNPFFDEVRNESLEELINSHILYNNNDNEWIDDSLYEIENIKSMVSDDDDDMELLKKYINKEFKYHEYMYSPPVKNNSKSSNSNSSSLKSSSYSVEFMDSSKSFGGSLSTNSHTNNFNNNNNNNNSLIRSDSDSEYIKKTFNGDDEYGCSDNDDNNNNNNNNEIIKSDIFNKDNDDDDDNNSSSCSDNNKSDDKELSRERTRDNRRNRKENYNSSITRTTTTLTKATANRNNSNIKRIIKKKSNSTKSTTTTIIITEKRKPKEMRKVSKTEIQEYINKIKEKENVIKSASNSRSSTDTSVTSEKEKRKEIMEEEEEEEEEVNDGEDIFYSNINELF